MGKVNPLDIQLNTIRNGHIISNHKFINTIYNALAKKFEQLNIPLVPSGRTNTSDNTNIIMMMSGSKLCDNNNDKDKLVKDVDRFFDELHNQANFIDFIGEAD